mmetsp:Transcript_23217/g.57284  ORF Transcript_23217/g.57284 Transcript_23217/m.57284 type:complete len:446 (+) Transcript_23217:216-1553(+)
MSRQLPTPRTTTGPARALIHTLGPACMGLRCGLLLLVGVLLQLASGTNGAAVAPTAWRTAALQEVHKLDEGLRLREEEVMAMREEVVKLRDWNERAGRRVLRRAAFDVGSGAVKMVVAEMDLHAGVVPRVIKTLASSKENCLLAEDLERSQGDRFSDGALEDLSDIITRFAAKARELGADEMGGVCTAAFRRAANGPSFLKNIAKNVGVSLKIITQEQEAHLGYMTVVSLCHDDLNSHEIVAWDSGGGSFQISADWDDGITCWLRSVGSGIATARLIQEVQQKDFATTQTPNPVSLEEAQTLAALLKKVIGAPPEWLLTKLALEHVKLVGIGGDTSIFRLGSELTGKEEYGRADVLEAVENLCGKTDVQFRMMEDVPGAQAQPHNVIPKLVLLYAVMDVLEAQSVLYRESNGNLAGVLATNELWGSAEGEVKAGHSRPMQDALGF